MDSRGFTLLELIVVLAIIALVLGVTSPLFSTAFPGVQLKSAARDVAVELRTARSRAILQNQEVTFALDLGARAYAIGGANEEVERLPEGIDVALITARSELIGQGAGQIRFFPDGSSTGGQVRLSREDRTYRVNVDWLTGRVSGPE